MPTPIPTPITDAAVIHEAKSPFEVGPATWAGKEIVHAHVARRLETELTTTKGDLADTKETLEKLQEAFNKAMAENLRLRPGVSAPVGGSAIA